LLKKNGSFEQNKKMAYERTLTPPNGTPV